MVLYFVLLRKKPTVLEGVGSFAGSSASSVTNGPVGICINVE